MGEATAANWDRRTLAFYGTLLGLVILDLIVMLWILSPVSPAVSFKLHAGTVAAESAKPSPFERARKASVAKPTPKVRIAQASAVAPGLTNVAYR